MLSLSGDCSGGVVGVTQVGVVGVTMTGGGGVRGVAWLMIHGVGVGAAFFTTFPRPL